MRMISLNTDPDTVFVQPIILDGQTAMVSLGAVLQEGMGRPHAHLGLAYDHRVINGFEANRFVASIKTIWEGDPEAYLFPV